MVVELVTRGTWWVRGNGPLRPILIEASTREGAVQVYTQVFQSQQDELDTMEGKSAEAEYALYPEEF